MKLSMVVWLPYLLFFLNFSGLSASFLLATVLVPHYFFTALSSTVFSLCLS